MGTPDPRVVTIEGRRTLVVERHPPLPPSLELLLEGGADQTGRVWRPLRLVVRRPLRLLGTRAGCSQQDHRLADWLEGFHSGSDAVVRYLRLLVCQDCGAVCVRDRSFDTLTHLPTGGQNARRKDHVIAWYSGARRHQRLYS
jgi:hypothetical protein